MSFLPAPIAAEFSRAADRLDVEQSGARGVAAAAAHALPCGVGRPHCAAPNHSSNNSAQIAGSVAQRVSGLGNVDWQPPVEFFDAGVEKTDRDLDLRCLAGKGEDLLSERVDRVDERRLSN